MHRRQFLRASGIAAAAGLSARYAVSDDAASLAAVTSDGKAIALAAADVKDLRKQLRGRLLLAQDSGYEQARRVLNAAIDRRPALIAQPTGAADVSAAVAFARANSLLVAVKCGGHSFSGQSTCDGGLLIDLSAMRQVRVDARSRRAWVAGGTLLGAVDHEALAQGLATPLGTVSHTGAGGLTTGGGFGRLARRFGLALDNVTAVDIVTADGRILRADNAINPDLFWGVRGGGGNFGVVTGFEFRLHPLERQVVGGDIVFPLDKARELLNFYADFSQRAPDELYVDFWMTIPYARPPVCGLDVCYSGPTRDAQRVLAPLQRLGTPLNNAIKTVDYVALQRSTDFSDARNEGNYVKSGFVTEISTAAIDTLFAGFSGDPKRASTIYFQHLGGAIARVAANATAYAHRFASHNMMLFADWQAQDDAQAPIRWARDYWKTLAPTTRGFYVNEVEGQEGAAILNENYLGNYPRLSQIKRKYDPTNLFRRNANITPT